jgi:putative DNA primase/helicase
MDAFGRAEVNTIKKVVSCQVDRYRDAYGYKAQDHPRQGIMAASTNKDDWNKDETGARRFWPISCIASADVEYVRAVREQCFVEALAILMLVPLDAKADQRVAAGAAWWVMPDAETRAEQRKRYDADPWLGPISEWLIGRSTTTVNDIAIDCLRLDIADIDRQRQMRVSACLRVLGWQNGGNRRINGRVAKVWTSPGDLYGDGESVATLPECSDLQDQSGIHPSELVGNGCSDLTDNAGEVATEVATHQNDIPFNDLQ